MKGVVSEKKLEPPLGFAPKMDFETETWIFNTALETETGKTKNCRDHGVRNVEGGS